MLNNLFPLFFIVFSFADLNSPNLCATHKSFGSVIDETAQPEIVSQDSLKDSIKAPKYYSAHAIVVSRDNDHDYVLLGKMRKSKLLSTFGGLRDPGEQDPKATCAREVEEEALGILGNQKEIYQWLQSAHQACGFNNGHICYVLPATFFGENIPYQFRKVRFNSKNLSACQREMIDIVAIRVDLLIEKFLQGEPMQFPDNQGTLRSLRGATQGALQAAIKRGYL